MIRQIAPAKINLYLHVGARRADGLHDLKSLFVFTEAGDRIYVEPARDLSLQIEGPFASALAGAGREDNLVWRAGALLRAHCGVADGAAIRLEKNLPVAAGIGGGSADAAAALRALCQLWGVDIGADALARLAFRLGADVPACLAGRPVNVAGAGELLSPGPALPPLWACLVNPGVDMPTGPVFAAFDRANSAPLMPTAPAFIGSQVQGVKALFDQTRNDLEAPARELAPAIGDVLSFLHNAPGALAARMSGSGATSFALFSSRQAAERTVRRAKARGWWALASALRAR